jgi:hypothetical protein
MSIGVVLDQLEISAQQAIALSPGWSGSKVMM